MELAASQIDEFLCIIEDIGVDGYKIFKYYSLGNSLQKTAQKHRVSKRKVQCVVKKCNARGYGSTLKELNMLK